MSTPGGSSSSSAMAAGFTLVLFAASVGITSGGAFASLLSLTGVLAGIGLIFAGVRNAGHDSAPAFPSVGALTAVLRPNQAVGLIVASCAVTAAAGEACPLLCFLMFGLLLLGLFLINIGVLSE